MVSESADFLAQRLVNAGEKTVSFFEALIPDQWGKTVYSEGSCWTVQQVLAHFVATEVSIVRLIQNILGGGAGAPEDFNIDAYNERKVSELQGMPPEKLLAEFKGCRASTISLVEGLSPVDLARQGRHPWLGVTEVGEIIKLLSLHTQIHQRDIRKLLG
jgi:hypothetical protein